MDATSLDHDACPTCGCTHMTYADAVACLWPGHYAVGPGGPWATVTCTNSVGTYQLQEHAQRSAQRCDNQGCSFKCTRRHPGAHPVVRLPWCPATYPADVIAAGNVAPPEVN